MKALCGLWLLESLFSWCMICEIVFSMYPRYVCLQVSELFQYLFSVVKSLKYLGSLYPECDISEYFVYLRVP